MATRTKIIDQKVCLRFVYVYISVIGSKFILTWDSLDFLSQITHPLPFWNRISFPYHKNASLCLCLFHHHCIHVNTIHAFVLIWKPRILHFSSSEWASERVSYWAQCDYYFTIRHAMLISHQYGIILCACISIFFFSLFRCCFFVQEWNIKAEKMYIPDLSFCFFHHRFVFTINKV